MDDDVEALLRDATLRWLARVDEIAAKRGGKVGSYWVGEEPEAGDPSTVPFLFSTAVRGECRDARLALKEGHIGASSYALAVLADLLLSWATADAGAAERLKRIGLKKGPGAHRRKSAKKYEPHRKEFERLTEARGVWTASEVVARSVGVKPAAVHAYFVRRAERKKS